MPKTMKVVPSKMNENEEPVITTVFSIIRILKILTFSVICEQNNNK